MKLAGVLITAFLLLLGAGAAVAAPLTPNTVGQAALPQTQQNSNIYKVHGGFRCRRRRGWRVVRMFHGRGGRHICRYRRRGRGRAGRRNRGWRPSGRARRACRARYGRRLVRALQRGNRFRCIYRRRS